ncbi:hypothetical protein [Pontibacter sp. HSC-36F09]|uniref:hypothetical protein n=1 Tax=Pontibacter sp. HSC-36F09 TaxID=2910966 RepID=UPI0020A12802|nr:hypothetical protein [Pontibacter sp. HSC-36F09]MCP2044858.1 hypothetical protein [Pontibacter sp. HSC-36F09]
MNLIKIIFACASMLCLGSCSSSLITTNGKKWNETEVLQRITDETVFFVDYEKVGHKSALNNIDPNDIAKITIYEKSDKKVPKNIKNNIENGVVLLITKKYAISKYRPKLSSISKEYHDKTINEPDDRDNLMYVIDGEILKPNVEGMLINLNFSKVKSIVVLSADEAQKIYGSTANNGVVIIR